MSLVVGRQAGALSYRCHSSVVAVDPAEVMFSHSKQHHQMSDHAGWVFGNQQWLTVMFRHSQVRASRGLPLRLMAVEYERILKRRLRIVGGSPNGPALGQLLDVFRCASDRFDHAASC